MLIIKGISQDIKNALELSNAPSADNLFAPMDDIDTLAEEADLLDINYGETSFQISGVGNNKLIIDDTNGLKYGDTSNYCLISPDGTLRLYGNAISYDDLMFDGSRVRTGSSAPAYTRYKRDVTGTSHTSNTFASPIALQSFDIHIQKDGFGSSEELIK